MTSLVGGERVRKNSVRLEAYGTIDEFSSALGVIASDKDCVEEVRGQILNVQNELFNIGCYLATEPKGGAGGVYVAYSGTHRRSGRVDRCP